MNETTVTTGRARLSYEHLFQPYTHQGNKPEDTKYSVTVLVPKNDVATKQRIDVAIASAKQTGVSKCWNGAMPALVAVPVYDGDGVRPNGERFGPECAGHWVFTASSKLAPQVVDINLNPIINQSDVYSGCFARVCVNFFPYNSSGKRGIGCGLQAVQKVEDGEPLGGRISIEDAFGTGFVNAAAPVQQPAQTYYNQPAQTYYNQPAANQAQQPVVQRPIIQQTFAQMPIDPLTGLPYNA